MSSRLTEIQNKKSESKETLQTLSRRYHLQTKSVANENNNDTNRSNSDDICLLRTLKNKLTQQQRDELKQNSEETVKCINEAIQHGKISCNVCGRHELLAVIGCYHFEMFRKKYEKFQAIIALEDQRMRAKRKADKEPDKDQPKRVPTDDERLFRRFNIESYPTLTNTRQLDKLLEFAKKSVDTFQKCSECLIEFTPKFLCQVNVLDVLRSLVFVFEAYGDLVYQHKAGSFYKALVVTTGIRIGTHRFYAYYCMLRVHLSVGLVDDASAYLKSAKAQLAPANLNENEGKTLKLAEIEIKLLCNEDLPAIANELKQLIESFRSIETLTITQTYLKCSALHLATRFHPRDFDFDANFEEFIVSMQSMMNLMRVYHPYLMDKKSDFKVVNTSLQSIWLRFANYRLLFQVFTTHNLFYKNMCLYPEHQVYYFNLTLALARLNCMTFW